MLSELFSVSSVSQNALITNFYLIDYISSSEFINLHRQVKFKTIMQGLYKQLKRKFAVFIHARL